MTGLLIAILYANIGSVLTERHALEIATRNPGDPNDLRGAVYLIAWHVLTWPFWVFKK